MIETLLTGLALVIAGCALGWTAMFSFLVAPQAFRDLDHGRANRFVRNALRAGNPIAAAMAALGALAAGLAGAIGAAAALGLASALFLLARWTLAPRDDGRPVGGRRKLSTARIFASALTAMTMLVLVGGITLAGLGA